VAPLPELNEISGLVQELHREMRKLREVIYEGNGHPPLLARLAVMEKQLTAIELKLESAQTHRWQVLLALVTGAISLAISIGINVIRLGQR
jgi:hypothetical protein